MCSSRLLFTGAPEQDGAKKENVIERAEGLGYLPCVLLSEEHSEREDIPDEIQRPTEHDRREAESRIKAFAGFAQCFSEHHESTRYRGRHNHEDKIAHLVL